MRGIPVSIDVFSTTTSMKIVPSAVICGVTSNFSTASTYCTEIVLLMVVWIGILVPCLIWAFSLFWVMTLGLESNLPTPLDSAAVMIKSMAKFDDLWENRKQLPPVPGPAGKFVFR